MWKDQPVSDCDFSGLVRWIKAREPYFEDKTENVVIVPVWAEMLMVDAGGYSWGWGTDSDEDGKSWCKWEYERYNPATQQFEKLPRFRTRTYTAEFAEWGQSHLHYVSPRRVKLGVVPGIRVAIDPDKRIVRYFLRVSVKREQPYRLAPQVPRHWHAADAIAKLEQLIELTTVKLIAGGSDREPGATGAQLLAV